ncbi:MAG: LysM peptidoglycan-binding domain-containing protein [Chloroflexi bacterium]|nr:LysM peptidoglycan-binding domain-containing protein [Chloroflexota bacterium]
MVKAGENLTVIAAKYGVTVKAIQDLNGITTPDRIFAGQKLKIPPKS